MKKIFFLLFFSFSFIFAKNIVCAERIDSEGYESHYHKICIEGQEYIALGYGYRSGVMAATGKKCICIPYKAKGIIFGSSIQHKFKEIK